MTFEHEGNESSKSDLTKDLHPYWHQFRRLKQDLIFLLPKFPWKQKNIQVIDEATLLKMSPEARKRYEESLKIK